MISVAVSLTCSEGEETTGATDHRAAVLVSLDAIPKDSLCSAMSCGAIVVDPEVHKLSRSTNDIVESDAKLHIRPADLHGISSPMVPFAVVAFQASSLGGDTVGIKVGILEPEQEDKLRVMLWIFAPHSLGVSAAVSLSRVGHSWKVDSLEYIEV